MRRREKARNMKDDYPVRIRCPITGIETTVFFILKPNGETYTLNIDNFNGCNDNFHGCPECDACKLSAFEIVKKQVKK